MIDVRILVADDHSIVREGIRRVLDSEPGMQVVAEAENGREAVSLVLEKSIDVVLMDISMPELNGIEAAREILHNAPEVKILILSMHSDRRFVDRALKAGVSGYLLKNNAVAEVVTAIKTVGRNKLYLSPGITDVVVEDYVRYVPSDETAASSLLTPREREVLQLLAEGKTTKEIAVSLYLSDKTVEGHRQRIMDKLRLHSIADLTKYAIREGLTSLDN
ncbi:MAG: response regulator transcription factor [bacterium]